MKRYARGFTAKTVRMRSVCKTAAVFAALFAATRILSLGNVADFSENLVKKIAANEKLTGGIVAFELGSPSILPDAQDIVSFELPTFHRAEEKLPEREPAAVPAVIIEESEIMPAEEIPAEEPEALPEIMPQEVQYAPASEIKMLNSTSAEPDIAALLETAPEIKFSTGAPGILIIHTHSSEAYSDDYDASDYFRTEDKNMSVIAVGDELASAFEEQGFKVIHDRNIYDYPSYTGSYGRTMAAVESWLAKYPCISVVIDLHRDAMQNPDGTEYRTDAGIEGENSAQVMFVIGTGESGLSHPNWEKNLTLAVHLQAAAEAKYPGLCRQISLTKERYNQHLSPGYFILEVGTTGNSLAEAKTAARLFADCAGGVFSQYAE